MQTLPTKIEIGLKKSVTFLQITDTHLTLAADDVSDERKKLCTDRKTQLFPNSCEFLEFAEDYVQNHKLPIIHTGDFIDFITPENLEAAKKFTQRNNVIFVTGNHEITYCKNNTFSEDDYAEDLRKRDETLSYIQSYFSNDIRCFRKELDEICLLCIDNADYQITPKQMEFFRQTVSIGKPIILFVHIPFYTEELFSFSNKWLLAVPEKNMTHYTEYEVFEQLANAETFEAVNEIKNCGAVKCIISGHLHKNYETQNPSDIKQIVTGLDTLREITVI